MKKKLALTSCEFKRLREILKIIRPADLIQDEPDIELLFKVSQAYLADHEDRMGKNLKCKPKRQETA